MKLKKEISLEATANKIGCVFLLGRLLYQPVAIVSEKFLNFKVIKLKPQNVAWYIALFAVSLFLLKVNLKEMFTRKTKENNFGFKRFLLLTIFFVTFDRFFTFSYGYGTGYYKLLYAMPITPGASGNSSNIIPIAISIFVAVICEEIIYRGIIFENLREYGDMFAVVVAGVFFGLVHGQLIVAKSVSGIILCILYVLGGNLKWPILVHFVINMGSGIPEILSSRFPQFTYIQIDLAILAFNFVVMLISLLFCLKDEILKPLFYRWRMKSILKKFKQDKSSYKEFFTSPAIAFSLAIEFLTVISVFVERLNVYLKK